ncbi:hypothetical protein MPLDJ20_190107 [Mesorhizobium plurifarium]|uniref:Uncharacterized protein n=1 Tax=Mesorhizobium plurifarium TaxID=69974 RepID=A0A090EZL2_MESPL|nr:hypothetical protein MPLDJ20_190107 [Mesorhizobium plurifarium]
MRFSRNFGHSVCQTPANPLRQKCIAGRTIRLESLTLIGCKKLLGETSQIDYHNSAGTPLNSGISIAAGASLQKFNRHISLHCFEKRACAAGEMLGMKRCRSQPYQPSLRHSTLPALDWNRPRNIWPGLPSRAKQSSTP